MLHNVKDMGRTNSPLGEFEQLVLLALVRLGPDAYGATIRREIETRTGRDLAISAVYITLDRLETKGLIRSRIGDPTPQRGGRRTRCFTVTTAGRKSLEATLATLRRMAVGLDVGLEPT